MATAARRIVATSEGGGRPSRQSRPERLAFYQCPFLLPLEVVGPGGSLSTVLITTPYWRDASRRGSWQAAMATAESRFATGRLRHSSIVWGRQAVAAEERTGFVGDGF